MSTEVGPVRRIVYESIKELIGDATSGFGVVGITALGMTLRLENRTSHPSAPEVGRIWIRTDL